MVQNEGQKQPKMTIKMVKIEQKQSPRRPLLSPGIFQALKSMNMTFLGGF